MYAYQIGYYSFEDSNYLQLLHKKKFNRQQFENRIQSCVKEALACYLKDQPNGVVPRRHDANARITFNDLHVYISNILCQKHGFIPIKFQSSFSLFGWDDMVDPVGWRSETDGQSQKNMASIVRQCYINEGLWHDPEDYKYIWDKIYLYKDEEDPLIFIKQQAEQFNVRVEYYLKKNKSRNKNQIYATILIRVPRIHGSRLPTIFSQDEECAQTPIDTGGRYFSYDNGNSHYILDPLWYSEEELYKKYKVTEEQWKILNEVKDE